MRAVRVGRFCGVSSCPRHFQTLQSRRDRNPVPGRPTGTIGIYAKEGKALMPGQGTRRQKPGSSRSKPSGGRPRNRVPSEWGLRVEAMAAKRGLTRSELAEKIGISYVSMWQLLMGQTKPKMETACRLADALGVPLDKLRQ